MSLNPDDDSLPEAVRKNLNKGRREEDNELEHEEFYGEFIFRKYPQIYEIEYGKMDSILEVGVSHPEKVWETLYRMAEEGETVYSAVNEVYGAGTNSNSTPKGRDLEEFTGNDFRLPEEDRNDAVKMIEEEELLDL